MKKIALALAAAIMLVLIAQPINAQIEACSVGAVNVLTDASVPEVHHQVIWNFVCSGDMHDYGQVTKMLYTIPITGITNFDASDSFGSLKVLEGPQYAAVAQGAKQSTIGVIFRKGLQITDANTSYAITVDFDSAEPLKSMGNDTFAIKPQNMVASPKVTIITAGITETAYQLNTVNYVLNLPQDTSVKTLPEGCHIKSGNVYCPSLSKDELSSLEITFSKSAGAGSVIEKLRQIASKFLPAGKNIFKLVTDRISSIIGK